MSDIIPVGTSPGGARSVGTDLPIALSYSTVLPLNQVNRPIEQLYFKNPYRAPLWVDEFQFLISSSARFIPPSLLGMRMKINDKYISDEFVPLSCLAPHTDSVETVLDLSLSFFWRLNKAMWLDELDDVSIELKFVGNLNVFNATALAAIAAAPPTVTVTMKGRSTLNANRPKERFLPFNVAWGPVLFETIAAAESTLRSPDSALRNGRNKNVVVTRLLSDAKTAINSEPIDGVTANYAGNSVILLNMRISHSDGYYIVKDLTPYFELFQNLSRVADFKFLMKPKDFITIELQTKTFVPIGYPQPMAPIRYLLAFGLQGYTTEALS